MDMEWLRNHLLGLLKGEEQEKVEYEAQSFVREILPKYKNQETFNQINSSSPLILISATLSPLAKAIAEQISADAYFATQMESYNGVFTGKIASDVRSKKLELLLNSEYAEHLASSSFMTDNKEDLPLVKSIKNTIIVTTSVKNQRFWLDQNLPGLHFINLE